MEVIPGGIEIDTKELLVRVFDNFIVDIYDNEGKLLCSDYRGERNPFIRRKGDFKLLGDEGHEHKSYEEYKVFVMKTSRRRNIFLWIRRKNRSFK